MKTFQENNFYHIYNRGTEGINIFEGHPDYERFMQKMGYYLYMGFELYSFCLLPNHFHLMMRVRTKQEQEDLYSKLKKSKSNWCPYGVHFETFKYLEPGRLMAHFKNSHTQYFNHKYDHQGSLFEGKYRRKIIHEESYFVRLMCYIHLNPVHHGLDDTYMNYRYSSYRYYLRNVSSILPKSEVMKWFGGRKSFEYAHSEWCEYLLENVRKVG